MPFYFTPHIILPLLSALVNVGLVAHTWRRRHVAAAGWLFWVVVPLAAVVLSCLRGILARGQKRRFSLVLIVIATMVPLLLCPFAASANETVQQVLQGKAEFGVGCTDLLLQRERGAPVVALAAIFQHSPLALMTLKRDGLQSIHDLTGRRVMIEPGSSELLAYLRKEGIPSDKITLLPHDFKVKNLLAGGVDAMSPNVIDEPFELSRVGQEHLLYAPRSAGIDFYGDNLFTTESRLELKPDFDFKGFLYGPSPPPPDLNRLYGGLAAALALVLAAGLIAIRFSRLSATLKNTITERKRAEESLVLSLSLLNSTLESTADGILVTDQNGHIRRWNQKFVDMWHVPEKLLNTHVKYPVTDHIVSQMARPGEFLDKVRELYDNPEASSVDTLHLADGRIFRRYSQPQRIGDDVVGRVWSFDDITARKRAEDTLRESEEKHRILFRDSPDAYLIIVNGAFVDCNRATEVMLRGDRTRIIGHPPEVFSPEFQPDGRKSSEAAEEKIKDALRTGINIFEWVHRRLDGSDFFAEVSIASMTLDGNPALFTTWRDITERKLAEKALEESNRKIADMSITDGLTGIANRRRFDEVLAKEHARHARSGAELSLILLDIDLFKSFNDRYGHVKGDECLREVARVMAGCTARPADLPARYGGEEFACILPETDPHGAIATAEKIRRAIMARAIPHQGSNVAEYVTVSLGVVTVRCAACEPVVEIVAKADELLYLAKSSGRNRVEFFATHTVTPAFAGKAKGTLVQLVWKDSFRSGNPLIDSQHQGLFHVSSELIEAALSGRPETEVSAIIARLLDDVARHFHDEQMILEAVGFTGEIEHVAEHAKLLARGLELSRQFKASTLSVGDVFQFLAYEMVMLHMLGADQEFFPLLSDAAASGPGAV